MRGCYAAAGRVVPGPRLAVSLVVEPAGHLGPRRSRPRPSRVRRPRSGYYLALKAINRRAGGRFTCLMLAMAAQWMLNRRGIASSLVLGTCNELNDRQEMDFKAHAWLRVGNHVVLGQHDGRFTALTSFIKTPGHTASDRSA
ncbi:lasso peptide biosynthesis B2 protein [Halomonas sp. BC04]|uniref:lasso peptide biosynthesis B2 protein n=1 Tax=Halomonas sp. BC04 TaxID=1403540 RepID=UPI0003ED672A|nr:lasso peptide biosynthesis B2 protein [Halomonas sp. BC04]EWH01133.1 hypothetical protein Q427_15425 [Halomonas sp. BC04]